MELKWHSGQVIPLHPSKILCVGRNYRAHALELKNDVPSAPMFFMKPLTALTPFRDEWVYPKHLGKVHYELEIALLIGQPLSRGVSEDSIREAILGVGLALDLTLREKQDELKRKGHPWELAKGFDGACPLSEFIPVADAPIFEANQNFTLTLNGQLKQQGQSHDMIFPCLGLIQAATEYFTLQPGDILLTGTPEGVGALTSGDLIEATLNQQLTVDLRIT